MAPTLLKGTQFEENPMRNRESGQALIATISAVALVLLTLLTAVTLTQFTGQIVSRELLVQGQTLNAAQAGLVEGLSWFRRSTKQPVDVFTPVRDTAATPVINDTDDASIGLVRNYEINALGKVWGRYEVRKTGYVSPAPASLPTATLDITTQKGKKGIGVVWQLDSEGIVYVRNDGSVGPDVSPNKILARRTLRSEIQRLALNAPADAALIVSRGNAVNLQNADVQVRGELGTGMAWVSGTDGPTGTGYPGQVSGSTPTQNGILNTPNKFTIPYVFGLTLQELRQMADLEVTSVASLPATLPDMKLILLYDASNPTNNYVFTSARPLSGTGILVVLGSLTIQQNSNSVYNGLIFVQGGYSQSAPSTINGTVIVDAGAGATRNVVMSGAGEDAQIRFDKNLLNFIADRMGLYRVTRSAYVPCTGTNCE
jgi:hypothetical protein